MKTIALFILILGIPLYFMTRADRPASDNERALAKGWVVFRRMVCFGAALLFGGAAVRALVGILLGEPVHVMLGLFAGCAAIACACIWTGIYGAGRSRNHSDDREEHERRKIRYGWKK
jgi:hypothetical protein